MNSYLLETMVFRNRLAATDRSRYLTRPGMKYIDVGENSVRLRIAGEGERTIVLAADSPILIEHHDRLFELLTPHMRVVCLDIPGFGFSAPAPDFQFTLEEFTDVLEHVLLEIGYDNYILSFPCFTAYMAMKLAERMPDKIERLILPQAPDWQGELDWFTTTSGLGILKVPGAGQAFMTGIQALAPGLWLHPWFQATVNKPGDRKWIKETALDMTKKGMINCWASIYQSWHSCNEPNFAAMQKPALSLWGPKDLTHYKTDSRSILNCVPHAHCCEFEHSAHYTYLQEPERYRDLILSLVAQSGADKQSVR